MRYKLHLYLFCKSKKRAAHNAPRIRNKYFTVRLFHKEKYYETKKARISPGSLFIRILIP